MIALRGLMLYLSTYCCLRLLIDCCVIVALSARDNAAAVARLVRRASLVLVRSLQDNLVANAHTHQILVVRCFFCLSLFSFLCLLVFFVVLCINSARRRRVWLSVR